jgi:hypothetical protein
MTCYVTVRLTREQAQAASNACDLIRDQYEADGQHREAGLYKRASAALSQTSRGRLGIGTR